MNDLLIYRALISDENEGILIISLVDMPATEVNWVCFSKNEQRQQFAIINEDEHILAGVVMIADTPIYRITPEGQEYYILFTKDVIKQMAEKMLSDNTFNNIDIEHNGKLLENGKVKLTELFISDKNRGITPNYVDVPDGSLMANYKIYDDGLWEEIKNGDLNGFSLEGIFSSVRVVHPIMKCDTKKQYIDKKMNKVKETLRKLLISLGEIETDKGVLVYEDELAEGIEVKIDDELAPDGEYISEEYIVVVKDGKVAELKEKIVEEEAPVDETVEEVVVEETPVEETPEINPVEEDLKKLAEMVEEHETILRDLSKAVEELDKLVKELIETPVAEPIEEEFTKNKTSKKTNKAAEIAAYFLI